MTSYLVRWIERVADPNGTVALRPKRNELPTWSDAMRFRSYLERLPCTQTLYPIEVVEHPNEPETGNAKAAPKGGLR